MRAAGRIESRNGATPFPPSPRMTRAGSCALFLLTICVALIACEDSSSTRGKKPRTKDMSPYVSTVTEGSGAAVMLLIDTSGSMKDAAPGGRTPKSEVARAALAKMLEVTDAFSAKHPKHRIRIGVMPFSSRPREVLPIGDYDRQKVRAALDRIPAPEGGTAIGTSLDAACKALYRSGCLRKYILVVTDGENREGVAPAVMAREIHHRSEGAVSIYFVAFDTDPAKFAFLREVGGDVVSARNATQLQTALGEIYEGRILAEAMEDITPIEKR